MIHGQCRLMFLGTNAQNYQQENTRKRSHLSNLDHQVTSNMEVKVPRCQASTRSNLMSRVHTKTRADVQNVVFQLIYKYFNVQLKNSNVKFATSLDTLAVFVTRKSKLISYPGDQRHTNYKQAPCMPKIVPFATNLKMTVQVKIPSACRSK